MKTEIILRMKTAIALLCLTLSAWLSHASTNLPAGNVTGAARISHTNFVLGTLGSGSNAAAARFAIPDLFSNMPVAAPRGTVNFFNLGAGNVGATDDANYSFTFVTPWGETPDGAGRGWSWNPPGNHIIVPNIPVSPSGLVTARKIYRSFGGSFFHHLVATISGNGATDSFDDNGTETSLTGTHAPLADTASFPQLRTSNNVPLFIAIGVALS